MSQSTMKYPIGVQNFEVLREENYVYVDKTDLVYQLAQLHVCFLCRPRRFGKSLAISTLEAYFLGKKHLFQGLKIDKLEQEWKTYPVFHIDFNAADYAQSAALENTLADYISRWEKQYGVDVNTNVSLGQRFASVLQKAHADTGVRAVVLVDEYDKPMLDVLSTPMEEQNRDTLKNFYSVFKLADADLRFVMLTGVTKFSQVSVFSGFNQPYDISMNANFETLCGITEHELDVAFDDVIQQMAQKFNLTVERMHAILKKFYDGYHFSPKLTDVYNPYSLLNAFANEELNHYWFQTGTPTYLIKLLSGTKTNMQQLLDRAYSSEYFIDYRADVEQPLPMLYQSGYLTIKEIFRQADGTLLYRLDYPNNEVKRGFVTMLSQDYFASVDTAKSVVQQMVDCLYNAEMDKLRDIMNAFLGSIDYEMRKDKEYHFQYTFYLIFSLLSTFVVRVEQHNSQGRADMVVETEKYIYIFEFKLDGTATDALQQIEDKQYALPYKLDKRPIYKIGASFGKQSGIIDDWECIKQL